MRSNLGIICGRPSFTVSGSFGALYSIDRPVLTNKYIFPVIRLYEKHFFFGGGGAAGFKPPASRTL